MFTSARLLGLCVLVGILSSAIAYGIDQAVLRRIPVRRFAVLLALLPVTAIIVGFIALGQRPSALDLVGAALVIAGVRRPGARRAARRRAAGVSKVLNSCARPAAVGEKAQVSDVLRRSGW